MSLLTNIFTSNPDNYNTYSGTNDSNEFHHLEANGITSLELATLLSILDKSDSNDNIKYFELLNESETDQWITSIPSHMVELLNKLDKKELSSTAQQFKSATEEELGWQLSDFEEIIKNLKELSSICLEKNMKMYHWMSV